MARSNMKHEVMRVVGNIGYKRKHLSTVKTFTITLASKKKKRKFLKGSHLQMVFSRVSSLTIKVQPTIKVAPKTTATKIFNSGSAVP